MSKLSKKWKRNNFVSWNLGIKYVLKISKLNILKLNKLNVLELNELDILK